MIRQISYETALKYLNREPFIPVKPSYFFFGYYVDDELSSCVGINVHEKRIKIECYFTDKDHRGKGYGTKLLRGVSEMYRDKKQFIDCLLPSKGICEKLGFQFKREKTFKYFTIYRMEKQPFI